MRSKPILFFYVTFPNQKEAQKMILQLLQHQLIACANLFPQMYSSYKWKKKITQSKECVVIFKSNKKCQKKLQLFIKKHHPYKTPCIAALKLSSINKDYQNWLLRELP